MWGVRRRGGDWTVLGHLGEGRNWFFDWALGLFFPNGRVQVGNGRRAGFPGSQKTGRLAAAGFDFNRSGFGLDRWAGVKGVLGWGALLVGSYRTHK